MLILAALRNLKLQLHRVNLLATYVPLEELLKKSDIIVFHCPLTEDTYHLINHKTISMLKDGVCLINTARGGIFDTKAVLKALKDGKISIVAINVYETIGRCKNEVMK